MIVRYTRQALADLDEALEYIARERPEAAEALGQSIRTSITDLVRFPGRGGPAVSQELVINRSPFIVAYRVGPQHIDVLAVLQGARRLLIR